MNSANEAPAPDVKPRFTPDPRPKGGSAELLKLAIPLVLASSFTTVQFTIDRAFLSWYDPLAMGASMPASMVFWQALALLHGTAGYAGTFVAQYTGAGRPRRVGPAVWQAIYFCLIAGTAFWALWPAAPYIFELTGHPARMQQLEVTFFRTLCAAAMPMALVAALSAFFAGRGDTWTVLVINAAGTAVTVVLDYLLIFGHHGFPEWGIAGAGWATAAGAWASVGVAAIYFLRPKFREEFATLAGWRPDFELMRRLLKFGFPAGMQWALEAVSFTFFTVFVGRIGEAEATATSLTFTLNMFAFLPMMGLGQAVCILVGNRLGENDPAAAERTTYTGVRWAFGYMLVVGSVYVFFPLWLISGFDPDAGSPQAAVWPGVVALVPSLLMYVALYSLADGVNVTFAFALRGAGDTRFVTLLTFALAWPVMIVPTYLVVRYTGDVYLAWACATAYIAVIAVCFYLRFRTGKWKAMRVIEAAPPE